jgi:phosphate acetyltransferase
MDPFANLEERAARDPRHIVLAEGEDPRIIDGAIRAVVSGIADITLLGGADIIREELEARDASDLGIAILEPATAVKLPDYAACFHELRRHKGLSEAATHKAVQRPINFADVMVRLGDADGSVAGAHYTTAETVRSALQIIGPKPGVTLISSFFVMVLEQPGHDLNGVYVLSDCGLVVEPDAGQLAQIGQDAADSFAALLGEVPRLAMLSFTTDASARHPSVDTVIEATAALRAARPDLAVAGDIQLDAALLPEIGRKKAELYPFQDGAGANVLIFPNLHAGNIGYKLMERFGRAKAIGPILQGLAKPANDLSRGCNADDVYRVIAVTVAQAQAIS